jgi:hypothetical protein
MFTIKMSVPNLRIDDVGWEEMFPSTHRLDIPRTVLAPIRHLKLSTADDSTGYVTDAIPNVGSVVASMSCLQDLELDFNTASFTRQGDGVWITMKTLRCCNPPSQKCFRNRHISRLSTASVSSVSVAKKPTWSLFLGDTRGRSPCCNSGTPG